MKKSMRTKKAPESNSNENSKEKDVLKSMPMDELQKKLESSPEGLTDVEAKKRLVEYGPNEISE